MVAGKSWNKLSRKALVPRHRDPHSNLCGLGQVTSLVVEARHTRALFLKLNLLKASPGRRLSRPPTGAALHLPTKRSPVPVVSTGTTLGAGIAPWTPSESSRTPRRPDLE